MPYSSHKAPLEGSVFGAVEAAAEQFPKQGALDFLGSTVSYAVLLENIRRCANSLTALGIGPGSNITIALPNYPQAVYLFYAANRIGCVAAMLHPLSSPREVEDFLQMTGSAVAFTLEEFFPKFSAARNNGQLRHLILTSVADGLPLCKKAPYQLIDRLQKPKTEKNTALYWKDFLAAGRRTMPLRAPAESSEPAAILCSGGTTGTPKGVILTNRNFNALAQQIAAVNPRFAPGDKMLCTLPMFHGFGLGLCIHAILVNGGRCVLLPRFTPQSCVHALLRHRCAYMAGVPTLFQALLEHPGLRGRDLGFLKGVFCGGDRLPAELKSRFDRFLQAHNAPVCIREGYGATETVAACCLTPEHAIQEGSVGLPLPDTRVKIVAPGTDREVPPGQEGEILVSGPTVMQGYLDRPEETAQALRVHSDGHTWFYTGDLGMLDPEGFLYFQGRVKRMIVSCGYNVYPAQLEAVLDAHPLVKASCVIGLPDPYRGQRVVAFIQPEAGATPDEQALMAYCQRHIAKYALPRKIRFFDPLPRTPLGKIDYRALEKTNNLED